MQNIKELNINDINISIELSNIRINNDFCKTLSFSIPDKVIAFGQTLYLGIIRNKELINGI